jgi:hypothetical protein
LNASAIYESGAHHCKDTSESDCEKGNFKGCAEKNESISES